MSFELRSSRLRLRRLRQDDARAIVAYRCLVEVARFQSWSTFDLADAARLIESQKKVVPDTANTWMQLAIVPINSDVLVGDCGIHFLGDSQQIELGITLAPAYQHRGIATEAIELILKYVFEELGKHRAFAVTDAENTAVASTFRRIGFRLEATFIQNVWFKGAWGSEHVFAMLQTEWRARQEQI
jgi:RimJ/RimL family protein N-acetyltransferase